MGMQQALGLVITEFFAAIFDEIMDIYKEGYFNNFDNDRFLATVIINAFETTGKRVVRIIREGMLSLFNAVKTLLFPPEDMSFKEAMHEAKKLLATGLIVSIGVIVEEWIDTLIKGTAILEPFSDILTAVFVGTITGLAVTMTVYYIDKKKNDKDAIKMLISQTNEKFDNINSMLYSVRKIKDNKNPSLLT